jgi:hypothetical protein
MRASALGVLTLVVCAASLSLAGEDPRSVAADGTARLQTSDVSPIAAPRLERGRRSAEWSAGEFDDPRWDALVRRCDAARVRLVATAFRVRDGGGPSKEWLSGESVLLDDAGEECIRAAVASGSLTAIGRTATTGALGEPIIVADRTRRRAVLDHTMETAIGSAVTMPVPTDLGDGLTFGARVAPHLSGSVLAAFEARIVGAPEIETVECMAGHRKRVVAAAFVVSGVVRLENDQTACVRGVDAQGDGFVLLLRADVREGVDLPARVGPSLVAIPTAPLAHVQEPTPLHPWTWRDHGPDGELVPWVRKTEDVRRRDLVDALREHGVPHEGLLAKHRGMALVRSMPGSVDATRRAVHDATGSGAATMVVSTPKLGRIVVPFWAGGTPSAFLGELRTHPFGVYVETGCDDCIATAEDVELRWTGLAAVLDSAHRPAARFDVATRRSLSRTRRPFPVRRLLPDHSTFVHESVADDRSTGARVRRVRVTDRVLSWDREGSCGMTYRFPAVSEVATGLDAALVLDHDGRALRTVVSLHGEPVVVDPAFDMGDGVTEIVRLPALQLETTLPLGAVRRVAWGGGLTLRLGVPGSEERPPLRSAAVESADARCGLLFADGARVAFECGTRITLPSVIDDYTSNHRSGEAATASAAFFEGVSLALDDAADGTSRGWVTVRGPTQPRRFELVKFQAPRRTDTAVNLALPRRTARSIALTVPNARAHTLSSGTLHPVVISFTEPTVEDEE